MVAPSTTLTSRLPETHTPLHTGILAALQSRNLGLTSKFVEVACVDVIIDLSSTGSSWTEARSSRSSSRLEVKCINVFRMPQNTMNEQHAVISKDISQSFALLDGELGLVCNLARIVSINASCAEGKMPALI